MSRQQPPGLDGFNPLAYMGVNANTPPNVRALMRAPAITDSSGFLLGDFWLWQDDDNLIYRLYQLVSLSGGDALWKEIVFDAANTYVTDNGTAIPVDGVLNVLGGNGIETNGAGNTITIELDGEVATQYTTDDGIAIPAGGNLDVLGGDNMNTSGAGDTININLNTSIFQPNTSPDASEGMYRLGGNNFLHNYGTDNTFLGNLAGNLTLSGSGNTGLGSIALNVLTSGIANVAVGDGALAANTSADNNVAVGQSSMVLNQTSDNNVAVGGQTLSELISGSGLNTAVGTSALASLTTGSNNVALGQASLDNVLTGLYNIAIGSGSGTSYATSESSNILMSNSGTVADNHVIRIGTEGSGSGQQNAAYMAGVYGKTVGATVANVVIDNTGKLGTAEVPQQEVAFYSYVSVDIPNVTGDGTRYTIIFDTTEFNVGAGYNTATGVFTAPMAGYYQFNIFIGAIGLTGAMTSGNFWLSRTGGPVGNRFCDGNWGAIKDVNDRIGMSGSTMQYMAIGDTCYVEFEIGQGAKVVSVEGNLAGNIATSFSGFIVGTV